MVCERDTLWSLNGTLSSNQIKSYYISNFHIYNLLPSTPITKSSLPLPSHIPSPLPPFPPFPLPPPDAIYVTKATLAFDCFLEKYKM